MGRKFFLLVESLQLNPERLMVLENHHLAISIVIIQVQKSQWILKLVGENDMGNEIFTSFHSTSL